MLIILLKSSACLAIFILFYKLLLEQENMHQFKRYYLLTALVVSFVIPFITFIKYVEPALDVNYVNSDHSIPLNIFTINEPVAQESTNNLPIILCCVYGLGVLLFLTKYGLNLFRIISKIKKNEKQKQDRFITVLLKDFVSPHTFFSYIFLNKTKFESKTIPQEVLLHEVTHAKQKHSIDILFVELLQAIFWFNPLLYFIKKDIKLNHEFLADDAVLKQGIDSSTYQKTLLAYSSNATEYQLANAINYSLIKKRFTIMKTKTSKKAMWLRHSLLLTLLGGVLFSFSSTIEVEKETTHFLKISETPQELLESEKQLNSKKSALTDVKKELQKADAFKINYTSKKGDISPNTLQETQLLINDIVCDQCELFLSKKNIEKIALSTTTGDRILSFKIKFSDKSSIVNKGDRLAKKTVKYISSLPLGTVFQLLDIKTVNKQKLPSIKIKLIDKNNKQYSKSPIVSKAKKSSLPPPPPPPTKAPQYENGKKLTLNEIIKKTPKGVESGYETLKNGESYYFTIYNGKKTYYNKDGYITDKSGKVLAPPPPPPHKYKK